MHDPEARREAERRLESAEYAVRLCERRLNLAERSVRDRTAELVRAREIRDAAQADLDQLDQETPA